MHMQMNDNRPVSATKKKKKISCKKMYIKELCFSKNRITELDVSDTVHLKYLSTYQKYNTNK